MKDKNETQQADDMASRIEKTLVEREQERINQPKETVIITDPEREKQSPQYFGYLMLLLGVVLGAVIGVALYFVIPGSGLPGHEISQQLVGPEGLDEADRLLVSGHFDPARKAYLAVISEHPESPLPYNNLATLYAAEGDFDQAQILLNKALETDQDYLTVYKNVGMVYAAMARDSYGKALQLKSKQQQVHLQMLGGPQDVPVVALDKKVPPEPIDSSAVTVTPVAVTPDAVVTSKSSVPQDLAISDPGASVSPQEFLHVWAKDWSAQDVDGYLGSYADDFKPEGALSKKAWSEKRKKRLISPKYIKVQLDSIRLVSQTEALAKVHAVQYYRSDRFSDRTRKSFVLKRDGQSWLIAEERSLGRVR